MARFRRGGGEAASWGVLEAVMSALKGAAVRASLLFLGLFFVAASNAVGARQPAAGPADTARVATYVSFVPQGEQGAGEYSRHFDALSKLSIAVAQAMPADQYGFKPHPESMNFGEVMAHIAATNYQFCAGLKDSEPPTMPASNDKDGIIKLLNDSFEYCSGVISKLTNAQLSAIHNSPDGRMPGRDVLLAMYVHVAHHRGQAEIYLRDKGIKPPNYRV
jgi:uncharacterized damage-inducible protein DinB